MQEKENMEDLEKKVNDFIGYPPEVDEGTTTGLRRDAFKAGYLKALEDLYNSAVDVVVFDDWQYGKDPDRVPQPAVKYRDPDFKLGQKVKIIIVEE